MILDSIGFNWMVLYAVRWYKMVLDGSPAPHICPICRSPDSMHASPHTASEACTTGTGRGANGGQWGEMGKIIYAIFGHFLPYLYVKCVQIIGLKAPRNYSDQFGSKSLM